MKRFLSFLLALCMLIPMLPALKLPASAASAEPEEVSAATDSWYWRTEGFTLIISGNGPMDRYNSSSYPHPWEKNITQVIIEPGVTSIGDYAFYNCANLKSVTIADTVTEIGKSAFSDCTNLQTVTLPDSVTSIGDNAFYSCTQLTSVAFGKNLETIGEYAFSGCTKLKGITFPESLTAIGDYAFLNCDAITTLTIPGSVQSIAGHAFMRCDGLTRVTINEGVSYIGANAFYECKKLTYVNLPNSITYIGDKAFTDCTKLQYNKYENGNYLGNSSNPYLAYASTSSFATSVSIHSDAKFVLSFAFYNTDLKEIVIPDNIISIANYAIFGCSSLESLTIPFVGRSADPEPNGYRYPFGYIFSSMSSSGGTAVKQQYASATTVGLTETYYLPTNLKSVTVTGGQLPYGSFSNCKALTSITLGANVTGIGDYAFENCTGLTDMTIPHSVTTFGAYAFSGCTGLTEVTLSKGITQIGDSAFEGCTALQNATMSEGITHIGARAFYGCAKLDDVILPDTVTTVGNDAFYGCDRAYSWAINRCDFISSKSNRYFLLQKYNANSYTTTAQVSAGTKIIHSSAFANCTKLTTITLPEGLISIGDSAFSGCTALTSLTIPDSVISIGNYAFKSCVGVTAFRIPDGVTVIGDYAFQSCSKATISIPGSVTHIGNYAFSNCPGETNFILPDTLVTIGDHAFEHCNGIKTITIPDTVTSIGSGAFYYCKNLAEISIPDSVTFLGSAAFYGCSALKSVHLGSSLTAIEPMTFYACTALTSIQIPDSATMIGGSAFNGCSALTRVSIGDGVSTIDDYAFNGCRKLAEIAFGKSISSIQHYAFSDCDAIAKVTIPSDWNCSDFAFNTYLLSSFPTTVFGNGKYIGSAENPYLILLDVVSSDITDFTFHKDTKIIYRGAFSDCTKLTAITVPDGVVKIGQSAFSSCSALKTITIPNSVTEIGSNAFWGCNALTSLTIPFVGGSLKTPFDTYQYPLGYMFASNSASNSVSTKQEYYSYDAPRTTSTTYYIPASLKSVTVTGGHILRGAFYNCSNLTSITLTDGVKSVANNAFYGCSKLTSVYIGAGVNSIAVPGSAFASGSAFSNTSKLERIEVSPDNPSYSSISGCLYDKEGRQILLRPSALKLNITVNFTDPTGTPLQDSIVTQLSYSASYNYPVPTILGYYTETTAISGTITEDTVINVVYYEKTVIANGNCGAAIGWTLYDDGMLVIKGTGPIPDYASGGAPWAAYADQVISAYVDPRITEIGSYAFENCSSMTFVDMGYSVTTIGEHAFTGCTSLKSLLFPETVTKIEDYAFSGCTGLTSILLSDNLTTIGSGVFRDCTALKKATLGAAVTTVGDNAFTGCTQLEGVYFRGQPAQLGADAFGSTAGKYVYYYTSVSGWSEAITDGLWEGYTAVPYNAINSESFTGSNIYILKVVDKHNTPLANAVVNLNGSVQATNEDGMAYFVYPEAPVNLSVSCSDHVTFTDPAYQAQQGQIMDIIELSDRPSSLQGVSCNGRSIATSVYTLNCNTQDEMVIRVNGYSKYDILRYELLQGNRLIDTVTTGQTSVTFQVKANSFEEGEAIIVKMYTADGSSVSAALNIETIAFADVSQTQILDELSQLNLNFNIGSLGSFNLPLRFKSASGQEIYTCTDGKTLRVGINVDVGEYFNSFTDNATAKSNIQKAIQKKLRNFAESDPGFQYNLAGYLEIEYLGNGQYYVKTSYVKIAVGAALEFKAQASYWGLVGVYFKASLSSTGSLELNVTRFTPEDGFKVEDVSLGLENSLELAGGAFVLWGIGSAELYGNLTLGFQLGIVPDVEFESVYVSGSMGVRWSIFWGAYTGSERILGGDIYHWPETDAHTLRALMMNAIAEAQGDPSRYTFNNRDYLEDRSGWLPGTALYSNTGSSYTDLQTNAYYNIAPKVVTCGDTTVMVWLDDNANRDDSNYQTLYYSVYENGVWSAPEQVDTNDTFDCEFDLVTDGKGIYVIYTEQKALLSGLGNLNLENPQAIADLIGGVEVAFTQFRGNSFSAPVRLTNNTHCETLPRLSVSDNGLVAMWNTSDAVSATSQSENCTVHTAVYTGGSWSSATALAQDQNRITDIAAVTLEGVTCSAYVVDTDSTQALILSDGNGNARQLAQGSIYGVSAQSIDGIPALVWNRDGRIYALTAAKGTPTALLPADTVAAGSYQAVTLQNGQSLLTFSAVADDNTTDIYAIRITADGYSGTPVRLTRTQGYINSYSISPKGNTLLIAFTETEAIISEETVDTNTRLCYTNYTFETDLVLSDVEFDISQSLPGAALPFTATVKNTGFSDISGITVSLYDGQNTLISSQDHPLAVASGETAAAQLDLQLPETITGDGYRLEVLPYGQTDAHPENNTAPIQLGYSDFSVSAQQKIIGGRNYLAMLVENSGNLTASAHVALYTPDLSGTLLAEKDTSLLAPGQAEQYTVEIDSLLTDSQRLVTCKVTTDNYDPFGLNDTHSLSLYRVGTEGFTQDPDAVTGNPVLTPVAAVYDKHTGGELVFTILEEADRFSSISGLTANKDYTLAAGQMTLHATYLSQLDVGVHTLDVLFQYGSATVTRTLTLAVTDSAPVQLTGKVLISGDGTVGSALYADISGITPLTENLSYIWSVDGVTVSTDSFYTPTLEQKGKTVLLTVTGGEGCTGSFTASVNITLKKPAAPLPPVVTQITDSVIRLAQAEGVEYRIDGSDWQSSSSFIQLLPNTAYTIYVRYAATELTQASDPSSGITVVTLKSAVGMPPAPVVENVTDVSVTLTAVPGALYSMDGVTWQESNSFTGLDANTAYTFCLKLAETDTSYESPVSAFVSAITLKHTVAAPPAPTINIRSDTTVSLQYVEGYEYSMDGIHWQRESDNDWHGHYIFVGLSPNTTYTFYQRVAETEDSYASPISEPLTARTWKSYVSRPSLPTVESVTHDTITAVHEPGYEYKLVVYNGIIAGTVHRPTTGTWGSEFEYVEETAGWQKSPVFTGLQPNTAYLLYRRFESTDTTYASDASYHVIVTTSKADSNTPDAPVLVSTDSYSITVETIAGYEYKLDDGQWQASGSFANLIPGKTYQIFCRVAETDSSFASPVSQPLTVTTPKLTAGIPDAPVLVSADSYSIAVEAVAGYEYKLDDGQWQTSGSFTGLIPGKTYQIFCRLAETETSHASPVSQPLTVTTMKLTAGIPDAPTVESLTWNSVTLVKTDGYLYRLDDGSWQTSNQFTGLLPNHSYTVYQKLAATDTTLESDSSSGTQFTTPKQTLIAPQAPVAENVTYCSVQLVTDPAMEYRMENGQWQDSGFFADLLPDTTYRFYQRLRETDTAYATAESPATVITTASLTPLSGEIAIIGAGQYGQLLELDLSGFIGDPEQITVTWTVDRITVSTERSYLVTKEDMGKRITVTVTGTGAYTGTLVTAIRILTYLPGDVDGDLSVTDWDSIQLNRYLAGWHLSVDTQAADMDADGKVTDWDAILLERYLAGWNPEA